jgi:hypothetical protein
MKPTDKASAANKPRRLGSLVQPLQSAAPRPAQPSQSSVGAPAKKPAPALSAPVASQANAPQPVVQASASAASAAVKPAQRGGRLRGVNNADTARRLQIKFPAEITMDPGDRVYGIDATRSSLVSSYDKQHRGELVSGNLRRDGAVAPVIINPLNDAYLADARGLPELAAERRKGFKAEASRYNTALAAMPEVQDQIERAKAAGHAARKDDDTRRRTFGVLSKAGINFAHQRGTKIYYGLDDMSVANAFDPDADHYPTVSSQEIRHIHANREALAPVDEGPDGSQHRALYSRRPGSGPGRCFPRHRREQSSTPRVLRPIGLAEAGRGRSRAARAAQFPCVTEALAEPDAAAAGFHASAGGTMNPGVGKGRV